MSTDDAPHDESTREARAPRVSRSDAALVATFLAPPTAWALDLGVAYALVDPAARTGSKALLWAMGIGSAVVTLLAAVAAWSMLRRLTPRLPNEAARSHARSLAVAACALSAFFLLAIVALNIPVLTLGLHDR
jgi:hypothetical protein